MESASGSLTEECTHVRELLNYSDGRAGKENLAKKIENVSCTVTKPKSLIKIYGLLS